MEEKSGAQLREKKPEQEVCPCCGKFTEQVYSKEFVINELLSLERELRKRIRELGYRDDF